MHKKILFVSVLALALAGNVYAQDEDVASEEAAGPYTFSITGTFTTDYVWRGVSQSQENAALQGSFDFSHESGFYAGIWGSSVDFTPKSTPPLEEDGADTEIDLYVGFSRDFADKWNYDISAIRYAYPGLNRDQSTITPTNPRGDKRDFSYNEFIGKLTYDEWLTGTVAYSYDAFAAGEDSLYTALNASYETPWYGISVTGEVGYYDFSNFDEGADFNYVHYGLGLAKEFGPFSTALQWSDSDNDAASFFGKTADSRVFFTVSLSTDL